MFATESLPLYCQALIKEKRNNWDGPKSGPAASLNKSVVYIASDMRNDGVKGVAKGVAEATQKLGWNFIVLDGKGRKIGQANAFLKALLLRPDGIVLGGLDAMLQEELLLKAKALSIPVVGWHASGSTAGAEDFFVNVTTDVEKVAHAAVCFAIHEFQSPAKIVIFTDNDFGIARKKLNAMLELIKRCKSCELLGIENLPLADTAQEMTQRIKKVLHRHGSDITHFIAINDLYFDYARPALDLEFDEELNISMISAGDGSRSAYRRIRKGQYQHATVPEPLLLQGWQIVDELNRAFNQEAPSGYVPDVHLVTKKNINTHSRRMDYYEPLVHYRRYYLDIWYGLSPQ